MPFSIQDADKHNKGLSEKGKMVWARVANSVLKRCEDSGGDNCDAQAIAQANGVVANMSKMSDEAFNDMMNKEYSIQQTFNLDGVEIFSTGIWNGDNYEIEDLEAMVTAFNDVGFTPPLKLGHNSEQPISQVSDGTPAIGWVGAIRREGEKLVADFKELPQKVYDAIKRGNYKNVSSEIYWDYHSNGNAFSRVLKAVALLGADIPAVTNLESIENLYTESNSKDSFKTCSKKENNNTEVEMETKEFTDKIEALEAKNKALEDEAKEYKDKSDANDERAKEAEAKLAKEQAEAKTSQIKVFTKDLKAQGKVLPVFEKELETLLQGASDTTMHKFSDSEGKEVELSQRATIEKIFSNMPKLIEFDEQGKESNKELAGDYQNASVEVDRLVKLHMDKTQEKDYSVAVKAVLADNPDLKEDYLGGD